ncbi:MAG: PTS sugar transporter subunit IIA [Chlorobiales bacterium]|nr:PTS sugar transporter subunit IIA [Chlorobiales bacterium]
MGSNRNDSFLRLIQRSQRGKLKIYLGYSSGVGKTLAMLQEAERLHENGIDIVAGFVDVHEKEEPKFLLSKLESSPRKKQIYRGIEITEMDIDAILQRQPSVVLVDELQHTNVPGSKNAKRYEDVEEILAAGIHVISTLNIQHLESLYETVEQVTGIKVKDRVPDRLLSQAEQLVNVDITPDDLRQRLIEGKIFLPGHSGAFLSDFFKPESLEQLRELTLRELASHIDLKRRTQLADEFPSNPDQIMVCLSSNSLNCEALIRHASRIAGRLNKNWYAVYVQTLAEQSPVLDKGSKDRVTETLCLARELGAAVFIYKGDDLVKTILQFAREYRVGHIIIGNSGGALPFWQRIQGKKSIVERLIDECRDISVTVFDTRQEGESGSSRRNDQPLFVKKQIPLFDKLPHNEWKEIVMNAKVVALEGFPEKEKALKMLLHECCIARPDIDEQEAWKRLLDREKQGGTYAGSEIGIPHARLEGLKKAAVIIGVHKNGVYDKESKNKARIIFLVLTPISDPNGHIKILGVISNMASDTQWRNAMLQEAR